MAPATVAAMLGEKRDDRVVEITGFSLETAFTSNGMEAVSPVGLRAVITPEPLAKDSTKPSVIRTKPAGSAVRATSLVWSATEPSPSV